MAIQPQPIRLPIGEAVRPERAAPYGVTGEAVLDSVKIDQAELVRTYSLLIPPDAEARISGQIRGWTFSLKIQFEIVEGEEPRALFTTEQDDVGVLKLLNWNNAFGICLAEPLEIARLRDQSKILLLASNQRIGKSNKLELQLLLQGEL